MKIKLSDPRELEDTKVLEPPEEATQYTFRVATWKNKLYPYWHAKLTIEESKATVRYRTVTRHFTSDSNGSYEEFLNKLHKVIRRELDTLDLPI